MAANFIATSSNGLKLPSPTEWVAPTGAPTAPGDRFPIMFSTSQVTVDPELPVISGWSDTAKPDESFTLSGIRFTTRSSTEVGSDTTVWLWGDTPGGGVLKQAKIWNVNESTLTALVPNDVPFGMYMVWVENSVGVSVPICLNRGTLNWLGPLGATVQPKETKRIFGKNLSKGHGTATAYVYLQPVAGGALKPLKVKSVEPYAVEFTVPAGITKGSYKVYLHNGHGGQYGWGTPLDLTIGTPWVRGNSEIVVSASGSDDTKAIQNAINKQHDLANGGTVRLKSGTYTIAAPLSLNSKVRLVGAGKDATKIAIRLASPASTGIALEGDQIAIEDFTIIQASNPKQPIYGPIKSRFPGPLDDVKMVNVRVAADSGTPYGTIDLRARRGEVVGFEAYRPLTMSGSDIWVHNSKFYGGTYDAAEGATYMEGNNLVMERNHFQTDWPTGPNGSRNYLDFISSSDLKHRVWAKRVFYTAPQYGSVERSYIAWNTTKDVAVDDNRGEMILFRNFDGYDALGPAILGNMLHKATLTVQASQQVGPGPISMLDTQISPYEERDINVDKNVIVGSAFENIVGSGSKIGIRVNQWTQVLFRNNKMTVANNQAITNPSVPQPVLIRKDADPVFSANGYAGATQKYTQATESTFGDKPVALYRVAHFQGKVGQKFKEVTLPILNAGIADMTWSVSASDPWITASVKSGGTVKPEAATGMLRINIKTSSMTSPKHWGIVHLTTASSKVFSVGVEVELSPEQS